MKGLFLFALPSALADFGKDTYAMSHPFAWKDFMEKYFPVAENRVQANSTSTCVEWVKLCVDDGHMTSCNGPQGNFQLHSVGAYKRDAGVKSMEQVEKEFSQSMGSMQKYDPYMDYHMAVLTDDLDHYVNLFNADSVPYFASTFEDENTQVSYKSVLIQTPGSLSPGAGSLLNIELISSSSSLLQHHVLHQYSSSRASSSALAAAHAHLASAPRKLSADGKPVLAKIHRSFASSDLARDENYFKSALQGSMTCKNGVCTGKMMSKDTVEFRYVDSSATPTQGPISVADWESYQVNLHNTCFDSENNEGFDRLADNHFGHALGGSSLDAYIKGQKASGLPYRFYGPPTGKQSFFYMYAPNGWGCQVIGPCNDKSLCPSSGGGYDMCTQGIKGHCKRDGASLLV